MKDGVSIMIPCYNGALYLNTLLECLNNQTYQQLHIIIVDDGSTDDSRLIIMKQKDKIEKGGRRLTYIRQENMGPARAINTALSAVDTKFFTWMDVDDRINDKHIESMVNVLINDKDSKWVSCKGLMYSENDLNKEIGKLGIRQCDETCYAEDLLFHRVNCTPGLYMVRTKAFMIANNGMNIYCKRQILGQNMQLLVPMAFMHGKPDFLDEFLFYYTVREDSFSHINVHNVVKMMEYIEGIQSIKDKVISSNTFISFEYKQFLQTKNKFFEDILKIETLFGFDINAKSDFIKSIFDKYLNDSIIAGRCIRIWGYFPKGIWLFDVLKKNYPQWRFGYIDSDISKCGGNVIYKDEINVSNDYIISLLNYHQDIEEALDLSSFKRLSDYLYFQKEINLKYGE